MFFSKIWLSVGNRCDIFEVRDLVNISKKGLFIIVVVWYIDKFIFMDDIWVLGLELYVV